VLTDLDRIVVAARERRPVVRALHRLLGAEVVSDGHLPIWAAKRTTLRAGAGEIEVLSPKGVGAVADFIGRRGPGIFAIGFAAAELEKFRSHLEAQAVFFEEAAGQLFLTSDQGVDLPGLNLVVTPTQVRAPIGLLQRFCGATFLHRFADPDRLLRILGARPSQISGVDQRVPGFAGNVIRVGHGSHLAILAPWGWDGSIARCFYQRGPRIYLVSAMTEQLAVIRERLASLGRALPIPSPDGSLVLPPRLLGGVRLALLPSEASCSRFDIASSVLATAGASD
jgi:hypothetical protein